MRVRSMRLVGDDPPTLQSHSPVLGIAARLVREILVEYAHAHSAAKHGGGGKVDVLQLDDALNELARLGEREGRIVELRSCTGVSIDETLR